MIGKSKIHIPEPKMLALAERIGSESSYPNIFQTGKNCI
jgi:hypothetical protein